MGNFFVVCVFFNLGLFFSLFFFFFLVGTTFTFLMSVEASYYYYYRGWAFILEMLNLDIQWPWVSFLSMGSRVFLFFFWGGGGGGEIIFWYQKLCQNPPPPAHPGQNKNPPKPPPPLLKKKKSANLSQFCTRKNPKNFWKKCQISFSEKKLQNFLETKSQDVIYLLSKKVGVLWLFYLPHWDLPNHGPNPNALGLVGKSLVSRSAPTWFGNV
jgi:hypothetical protein